MLGYPGVMIGTVPQPAGSFVVVVARSVAVLSGARVRRPSGMVMQRPSRRSRKRRDADYDESGLSVGTPDDHAAGAEAVAVAMKRALERMGPSRTARTLLKLNQ